METNKEKGDLLNKSYIISSFSVPKEDFPILEKVSVRLLRGKRDPGGSVRFRLRQWPSMYIGWSGESAIAFNPLY